MKKLYFIVAISLLGIVTTYGQCLDVDYMELYNDCSSLKPDFSLVKTTNVKPGMFKYGGEKVEFKYMFTKGSTYLISLCDRARPGSYFEVEVYNRNHKLVASNYSHTHEKHYSKIFFPCGATGVYYLKYSFTGGTPSCGVSVVGVRNSVIRKID